jgi:C4-dicarboxylate transporter, DctQ subunit
MKNTVALVVRSIDRFNSFLALFSGLILIVITLLICIEVASRTFLDISNNWLVELSEISLLYVTFLSAAWVLARDKHVSIDLLINHMNQSTAKYIEITFSLLAGATCFVLCWFGALTVIDQFQAEIREPTIMAPLTFWITLVIPFGMFLLGIQFIRRVACSMLGLPIVITQ